jgi:uncharacterized protein (DUF4415 family)
MRKPRYGTPDDENPEWTAEDFAKARPARDVLPPKLFTALTKRPPGRPRLEETKVPVTIRLDRRVVEHFKAQGPGWQTRMNDALLELVKT